MKKRISALVLSSCLLAGCAGQGAAATGETAAPSQAVPTAAPQSLTVNGLLDTSAAVGALELYAQAQNVTLQNSFETETADLVILDAPPQDDGTWKNLAENELLAAAAVPDWIRKAPSPPCRWARACMPIGRITVC